jgi:MFS family permease
VAALGGLLFGYDLSIIAGANDALQKFFALSDAQVGIVGSSAILGCIPGALMAGFLGDKLGRKKSLVITGVLYIASAVWSAYPASFNAFLTARFINGLAVGAASMICPTYISELAPKRHRGWLGTLFQLGIVTGIFVVFFCIRQIRGIGDDAWYLAKGWRLMLISEGIPAAPFLFLLFLVPESPRWLLQVGKHDRARSILASILGHAEAESEIREIKAANSEGEAPFSHLFSAALRRPLVIACGLALFCQFCGINAIMYYAPKVFETKVSAQLASSQKITASVESSGKGANDPTLGGQTNSERQTRGGTDDALKSAVWVGAINLVFTFVAIFCIDLLGRRPLLLIGTALQVVMLGITGWMFNHGSSGPALLLPILGFCASFAMAMGPLPWVVISEIFPGNIRGRAASVGIGTVWVSCYLVALTFPGLMAKIGLGNTFFAYAACSFLSFFFVLFLIPETKGRTIEEIAASWTKK